MGKCILHFDRIQIIDKKSGSTQADNDWMIVHWFVGRSGRQLHALPLANASGAAGLESGDTVRPLSLEVNCGDDALVTAAYQVVNLGACDALAQAKVAGDIALRSTQALTQAYVEAVEFMVENQGAPPGGVFDGDSEEMRAAIRDSLIAAFEEDIIPHFDDPSGGGALCGHGYGDVLHDIALFPSRKAMPPLRTRSQVYATDAKAGSGRARTIVHLTLKRRLQTVSWLPSGPHRVDGAGDDQASC